MQPHSMCAVALAGYMWNRVEPVKVTNCSMEVEYTVRGRYKKNVYRLSNIAVSSDNREISFSVIRDGGGLACVIDIRRSSFSEGFEVTMTHRTTHISGLREVYNLYKNRVSGGFNYNSRKYGGFKGTLSSDRKTVELECEVRRDNGSLYPVKYTLKIRL